jgi:hypothetical protein
MALAYIEATAMKDGELLGEVVKPLDFEVKN